MPDSYLNCLIIFSLFALIGGFLVSRDKYWYSPSSLFLLVWILTAGFSLVSAPGYYFSATALLYVFILLFVFWSGSSIIRNFLLPVNHLPDSAELNFNKYRDRFIIFYLVMLACSFLSVASLLNESGLTIQNAFNWEKIKIISSELTEQRYAGGGQSRLTMLLLSLAYAGAIAGGWMGAIYKSPVQKICCTFILIPVFAYTFICTAKAVFLFGCILWLSGFLAASALCGKTFSKIINPRNLVFGVLIAACGYFIFIFAQAWRLNMNPFTLSNFAYIADYIKSYFSGNISAYSIWFDNADLSQTGIFFGNTLAGIYEQIGLLERKPGIYHLQYDVDNKMTFTNIFTLFRFITDDFSLPGALCFMLILGICSSYFFQKSLSGSAIHASLLAPLYALVFWSGIASIWAYNSVLFACILFFLFIAFLYRK